MAEECLENLGNRDKDLFLVSKHILVFLLFDRLLPADHGFTCIDKDPLQFVCIELHHLVDQSYLLLKMQTLNLGHLDLNRLKVHEQLVAFRAPVAISGCHVLSQLTRLDPQALLVPRVTCQPGQAPAHCLDVVRQREPGIKLLECSGDC